VDKRYSRPVKTVIPTLPAVVSGPAQGGTVKVNRQFRFGDRTFRAEAGTGRERPSGIWRASLRSESPLTGP
jgi:hypothetical protein